MNIKDFEKTLIRSGDVVTLYGQHTSLDVKVTEVTRQQLFGWDLATNSVPLTFWPRDIVDMKVIYSVVFGQLNGSADGRAREVI